MLRVTSVALMQQELVDNGIGIRMRPGSESRLASNDIQGGRTGMRIVGSGRVEDNEVSGAEFRGIDISTGATVSLSGNTSCDNAEDLFIDETADPQIDDTNTFCDQASTAG